MPVARALVQHLYLIYGCPDIQVSDQGKEFQNELMKNISQILGIHLSRTCAYRPSSNGCVERVHRTINSIFAKTLNEDQRNWCEMAPYVAIAYNTAYHSSTTFSPFYLLYLREPRLPIDLALENDGKLCLPTP